MTAALLPGAWTGAAAALALLATTSCGSASTPAAGAPAPAPAEAAPPPAQAAPTEPSRPPSPASDSMAAAQAADTPSWLVVDSAGQTVTIAFQVTPGPAGGPALLNGHQRGDLQIVVPLNWTVQWDWRSADSAAQHSLVVMAEREKLPTEGGRAAFDNAMTRAVTAGLPAGQGDRTTFTADQAGWYWLLCGVPGHAIAGEYLGLRVDPEAKTASVKAK